MIHQDQITLRQLRALAAVHDHDTVVAAAKALNLTGPAIHNQLNNLQETIGAPLFERDETGRGGLSAAGLALLRAQIEMSAILSRTLREIAALSAGHCGALTLGVVSTGKYFAPAIVSLLAVERPDIAVSLRIGNRRETIEGLARGEFDLCIMGRPPREPLVEAHPIAAHPHIVIARPDHPLAGRKGLAPRALARERFVMREEGSGTRILAERFLGDVADGQPVAMFEMTSNETIKQSVLHGLGIAVISAHTVAYELSVGRLVRLDVVGMPVMRTWYVTMPLNGARSPIVEIVRDWLIANAARYVPQIAL